MSERKPGWYWVKHFVTEWECQYWTGDEWDGVEPIKAGHRIPTPDEPWAIVPVQPDVAMIDAVFWAWGSADVRSIYIDMISSAPKPEDT